MEESIFTTQADSGRKVMQDIEATVKRNLKDGLYNDARIARAERHNLAQLKSEDEFLSFYLSCLREASVVDISDYEIHDRRRTLSPVLIQVKTGIWKILKFYTYRLWSQQNQVNGLLVTAIEGMQEKYQSRLDALEKRVADLEGRSSSD